MARATPTMEMFLVGAHLQLVEGCETVTYHSELPNPKEFWVDVVGRSESRQSVYYVDFADKFDWYPPEMRPDTLVKKMTRRFVEIWRDGRALEYPAENVHCQLWLPRPPAKRVADAIPTVVERLRERHYIELQIIEPDEVRARVPAVVEAVRRQAFDYDNPFIRALLLADGQLAYQAGAPMSEEHIAAMYTFPAALASAQDIPAFVEALLSSPWVVHWLGFESPSFDDLRLWLAEEQPIGPLAELLQALERRGEAEDAIDSENQDYMPRRYTAREAAEIVADILACADDLRRAGIAADGEFYPLQIEIDFMLPYLSRAENLIEPSVIEREILRYGGNRDEMMAHFAERHPHKVPYRAILRIELFEPGGHRLPGYQGGNAMEVPIADPMVGDRLEAALTINYATYFTGYVILMLRRFAASL